MRFISKIIFFYLFLYSFSINASVQKPSIAFFILDKNNNNQSIILSLSTHLNQKGFISKKQLVSQAKTLKGTTYGDYLIKRYG